MTPRILPGIVAVAAISALALAGCSDPSSTGYLFDTAPPATPVGLMVERVDDTLVITWTPNTEADLSGYRLWRSLDYGVTWVQLTNNLTSRTSYVDELHSAALYRVEAHDNSGNSSPPSAPIAYYTPSGGGGKDPTNPA
jgi:hypothetical protein